MTISIPRGSRSIGLGFEEAIVDGVVLFENEVERNILGTKMLILKMRGTNHSREYQRVVFTEKGVSVVPLVRHIP